MDSATIIAIVGFLIFLAHLFETISSKLKIPDVLFLVFIGFLAGPLLNIISTADFGIVGPIFISVALVVILFQGGTQLKIATLMKSFGGAFRLVLINFILTAPVVAGLTYFLTDLGIIRSLIIGVISTGTSSAIVIPLVKSLNMGEESETVLSLESAFSDVIVIVVSLALIDAYRIGDLSFLFVAERMFMAFGVASVIGFIAGILWSMLLDEVRQVKDSIFMTPAFAFVIYGVTEMIGFSGAIAALVFGITLGNIGAIRLPFFSKEEPIHPESLSPREKAFLSEIVFLIKTFFFIFMGISMRLSNLQVVALGVVLTVASYLVRLVSVRLAIFRSTPDIEASLMSVIAPKGLAAAVLASIPLQLGMDGGGLIQNITYMIILTSIVITSIMVFLVEKTPVFNIYKKIFAQYARAINIDVEKGKPMKID